METIIPNQEKRELKYTKGQKQLLDGVMAIALLGSATAAAVDMIPGTVPGILAALYVGARFFPGV